MITSTMTASKPEEIQFTMRITMSLAEWSLLRGQLETTKQDWLPPVSDLKAQIIGLELKAQQAFFPAPEKETKP